MILNPEKVGKFIKKIRKDNKLTQAVKELHTRDSSVKAIADKYGVTYQAVSKWENGINLPEVTLIRQMSKDFDISVEDILDGKLTKKRKRKYLISIIIIINCRINRFFTIYTI